MKIGLPLLLLIGGAAVIYAASEPKIWGPILYPLQYRQAVKTYAQAHSLDPNLVAAIIYEESRFNAGQESRAGARGLMQLLPSTGEGVAKNLGDSSFDANSLLEPDRNIRYGTYYFKYLLDKYRGDQDLALAAYNAGETNVDGWIKEGKTEIPFPETKTFVAKVKQSKETYDMIYGKWYEQEK